MSNVALNKLLYKCFSFVQTLVLLLFLSYLFLFSVYFYVFLLIF